MSIRIILAMAVMLGLLLPAAPARAQTSGPATVSATATLTILAGAVQHVPSGGLPVAAQDGTSLAEGDRVVTGPDATALVTFLDGSTLTVQPNSDITVKTAQIGGIDRPSIIGIQINLGTVWARVVRLFDPGSRFSLESSTATATARSGLIGGQQNPDGSFVCWTRSGQLEVIGKAGQPALVLEPGQATTVQSGQDVAPRPFRVHQSALRVSTPGHVLPLLQVPSNGAVAGFVSPGIEVNQVFGSETAQANDGGHRVEVPAGTSGPYILVLEGIRDGSFTVVLEGTYQGTPAYRQELTGRITRGERITTEVTQRIEPSTSADPRTARVLDGSATTPRPADGPLPGKLMLAPVEVQAIADDQPSSAPPNWLLWVAVAVLVLASAEAIFVLRRFTRRQAGPPPSGPSEQGDRAGT